MHGAVMWWLRQARQVYPLVFACERVLECGSYDINGSARGLFTAQAYTGLDWRPGPGVDVVGLAHEYADDRGFDTVISTQMLEHDPHWRLSLRRMWELLRPGGTLIVTWAGPLTARHEVHTAPEAGYYAGLALADVVEELAGYARAAEMTAEQNGADCFALLWGKRADGV